ncbi:hypothetical protein [Catellicoccus marimammalium]|uniref:Uncharacterized protein n=1 Tax=Catellicoccus marimammalium M35/04/3 TaxID=1234409 RepID=K8ZMQ7_9ENTE|nr:hypothetical protein [Catellicoccus marimammalium]EKU27833.1 hypothetical protein C683_0298 [Catellicoccus marimammalium M35/04/3]
MNRVQLQKQFILQWILILCIGVIVCGGIQTAQAFVDNEGHAATVGVRFNRPLHMKEVLHPDKELMEQLEREHRQYAEGKHIAMTTEEGKFIAMLIGYSLIIIAGIQFFKGRNMRS